MIKLSKRLQGIANLVTAGSYIADVGTDHAYVPIFLCQSNRIVGAIAMDINEGPLCIATGNVRNYGLEERIELRLSDGFTALNPGEVDLAILAGMGGALMIKILRSHWQITTNLRECVLQPQSELLKVRKFLFSKGFVIVKEDMIKEEDKYYPMMKVRPPGKDDKENNSIDGKTNVPPNIIVKDFADGRADSLEKKWSKVELTYGKLLLEDKHPILKEFLEKELRVKTAILEHLSVQEGVESNKRKETIQDEIELVRKGMSYYEV